jgi:hypothetical protein
MKNYTPSSLSVFFVIIELQRHADQAGDGVGQLLAISVASSALPGRMPSTGWQRQKTHIDSILSPFGFLTCATIQCQ